MTKVYTNYWENRLYGIRKQHGSYATEEEALNGIYAWWELQKDKYEPEIYRTNTGALEVKYLDNDNYVYRVEEREIEGDLPSTSYQLKTAGQIEADRAKLDLDESAYLFDELAEPYRDRLIVAMNDSKRVRDFIYTERGRIISHVDDYHKI
ncbi:hypothetical protein AWM75_01100 [Aerococcus urinaehominis]|uniref:Uncharacterized protein n=1 Tax=Aerococcus urinaehominis TaxID=128944 RepID=A0A0X8FJW6_9LACT|nr:hypothetical protein [Aerococcus urinaehominis]AMB98675.1 hypothetical protein AWM75_01100 [Aerococcus urinaehominis]SDL98168.1 hypothetical protein SAMN04487985_10381 [Aerococcus urinaehominis]